MIEQIAALERAAAAADHAFMQTGRMLCVRDAATLRTLADSLRAGGERAQIVASIPSDLARVISEIGKAEWGTTEAHDADGHAAHIAESVRLTAEHFGQDGPQMMHGLYIEGTGTVICHTGTSPNSPQIARALTGAWNMLLGYAADAIASGAHTEGQP